MRGTHQGQQSRRTAATGRTHDCKRHLHHAPRHLLHRGGHPHMRRRDIIGVFVSTLAWPLWARAASDLPVIGFLSGSAEDGLLWPLSAFQQGLVESGYVEGQNVAIEYRWAESRYERLPDLAADLVRRNVAVI